MRPAELSRRANLDQGLISRIRKGETKPTPETLQAIAKALNLPVEYVYRCAGLLPKKPIRDALEQQALYLFDQIQTEEGKQIALDFLKSLAERRAKKKTRKSEHKIA